MSGRVCVSERDLRAFLLGDLPDRLARQVTRHLEGCPGCEAAARRLDDATDPFMRSLQRVVAPAAYSADVTAERRPATPAAQEGPALPRTVAGYEVLGELGRGGMGVVYKARQARPERLVALKLVLAGAYAGAERRARFVVEADAIARLQHPNIVQVYEAGEYDGLPFLALEYVEGGTLAQRVAAAPLPPAQAAGLVEALARAAHFAHARGVVHRDLTPGNVLLAADGTPKIADFGLAKLDARDLTATGALLGTPSYMAPEQAAGQGQLVGPAADVYALGAILYELLTGRPPFRAATVLETLEQVRGQEPVLPRLVNRSCPGDLETVCLKCLHKEPEGRYASAQELAEDLRRFREGAPIRARQSGRAEHTWRWCRRNPVVAGLLGAVALLLVAVAAVASLSAWRAGALLEQSEARGREARERLFEAKLGQARASRMSRRVGQRFETLEAIREAVAIARELGLPPERYLDLRNEAVAALALVDVRPVQEVQGVPEGFGVSAFDPSLTQYVCTSQDGTCSIRRVIDGAEVAQITGPGTHCSPHYSPDGRFLATFWHAPGPLGAGSTGRLVVWRLGEGGPVPVLEQPAGVWAWDYVFGADGRLFAIGLAEGALEVHDLDAHKRVRRLQLGWRPQGLAFHPSRPWLAVMHERRVVVFHAETGAELASLPQPERVNAVAWQPGRDRLAACCDDGTVYLTDLAGRQTVATDRAPWHGGLQAQFDPGGDLLACIDWDMTGRLYDVQTGRLLLNVPGLTVNRFGAGRRLAFQSPEPHHAWLLELADRRPFRLFFPDQLAEQGGYWGFDFSPDGRILAAGAGHRLELRDLQTGRELASFRWPRGDGIRGLATDASGAFLTHGPEQLLRWPLRSDPAVPARRQLGPPEVLLGPVARADQLRPAVSRDGGVVAVPDRAGLRLWRRGVPGQPLRCPHPDARYAAVSPDGRLAASGSHWFDKVKVWNTSDGRLEQELPLGGPCTVDFSPDGRWLATSCGGVRLWEVGRWEKRPALGPEDGHFAFWPDSRAVAVVTRAGVVRLLEVPSGRELVRLESPILEGADDVRVSPDGAFLVANAHGILQVWDLRAVRRELAQLGLDWDAPPLATVNDGGEGPPLKVTVDGGCLDTLSSAEGVADTLRRQGDLAGALAVIQKAQAFAPDDAVLQHYLAYMLAVCPDPKLRDAKRAAELARKATDAMPDRWEFWRAFGLALHFAGEDRAAVQALTRSLGLRPSGDAFDYFPLAAAHQQLGHKEEARRWYDRGVAWMAANKHPYAAELAVLRADAEARLGIGEQGKPAPGRTPLDKNQ